MQTARMAHALFSQCSAIHFGTVAQDHFVQSMLFTTNPHDTAEKVRTMHYPKQWLRAFQEDQSMLLNNQCFEDSFDFS